MEVGKKKNTPLDFWSNRMWALCCWAQRCGFDAGRGGCFSDWGEKWKRACVEILPHAKDPQEVKKIPEPFTTAHLTAQV